MKKLNILFLLLFTVICITGCERAADRASRNLSVAADNFEVHRRIVFYNGITDSYILTIEGLCSLGNDRTGKEVSITCKTGVNNFKKHFLGLSDNVTFFVEHLEATQASTYNYRVIFRPQTILPDISIDIK